MDLSVHLPIVSRKFLPVCCSKQKHSNSRMMFTRVRKFTHKSIGHLISARMRTATCGSFLGSCRMPAHQRLRLLR